MSFATLSCAALGLAALSIALPADADLYAGMDADAVRARSVVDAGAAYRVRPALRKALNGETVTIGAIGGSITQGAMATKPEFRWADRVAQWWRDTFPQADIRFVNAGIGATGSDMGAHRAKAHLLVHDPDMVFIEYAVNDSINPLAAETLEGLIRQILAPNQDTPGAMMLFTMNNAGANEQDKHIPVGKHYGLPMVSFRDAIWPEVEAGHVAWEDIEADTVHPNDRGHAICADLITQLLEHHLAAIKEEAEPAPPLPAPLISDVFEHALMRSRDNLSPVENQGWSPIPGSQYGRGWAADEPGSTIAFDVEGTAISLVFWRIKQPMGIAEARVDDGPPVRLEAWFNADWGGYTPFQLIARDLEPGTHRLRVTVLDEQQEGSVGHRFEIHGIACAGAFETPAAPLVVGEHGVLLREGKPFRAMGVNYFDAFYRALLDPTDTSYTKGFAELATRKIPFVRFMASGFWPVEYKLYLEDKARHFALLDAVVAGAEKQGIGLIPSIAWYNGCIPDVVGEPRNAWGDPESKTLQFLRQYTTEVVSRYVDSPAIWAWELGNEWSLSADLPNAAEWRPKIVPRLGTADSRSEADDLTTAMIQVAFEEFAKTVRAIDPARPITTGNSAPRSNAEHIRAGKGGLDSREQFRKNLIDVTPFPNNMVSMHLYPQTPEPRFAEKTDDPAEALRVALGSSRAADKALFVGEFGVSEEACDGDQTQIRALFDETLSAVEKSGADLSALWVYDHGNQDGSWNVAPENRRAYQLEAVAAANARLAAEPPVAVSLEGTRNDENFPVLKIHLAREGKDAGYINIRFPEVIQATPSGQGQPVKYYQDNRSPAWPVKLACEPVGLPVTWHGDPQRVSYTMPLDNGLELEAEAAVVQDAVELTYALSNGTRETLDNICIWSCIQMQLAPPLSDKLMDRTYAAVDGKMVLMRDAAPNFQSFTVEQSVNRRFQAFVPGVPAPYEDNPMIAPHPGFPDDPDQRIWFWCLTSPVSHGVIATTSVDGTWTVATAGEGIHGVWTNPGISCHHADPIGQQVAPGDSITISNRIVFREGSAEALNPASIVGAVGR